MKYFLNGLKYLGKFIIDSIKYFFIGIFDILTLPPRALVLFLIYIFDKKQREYIKKKRRPFVPTILLIFSLSFYFMSIYIFFRWSVQTLKIKNLTNDIANLTEIVEQEDEKAKPPEYEKKEEENKNEVPIYNPTPDQNNYNNYDLSYININFNDLLAQNKNTVAWIEVLGTKVNYPVVQAENNDYYLSHDFNNNENSAGWVFADWRVDLKNYRKNTIIYGHNMNNKTMFGSLPSTLLNSNWQNDPTKHFIKISTPYANSIWKIFSVYTIEPEVSYLRTIFENDEYISFLQTIQSRSFYNFNTDVSKDDYIITLSTCDNTGKKRMVTHAKLIRYQQR